MFLDRKMTKIDAYVIHNILNCLKYVKKYKK